MSLAQSISALKNAIDQQPRDPALYYELAGLYFNAHQLDEAEQYYQQALALAPNHPQILLQLGNTMSAKAQHAAAAAYFKLCIQADQRNSAAYYNLGNALRALGQVNQAIGHFKQAIALAPQDADAYNNLGNALRDIGRLDEAIDCYTKAMQLNPQLYHAKVHWIHQKQHICDWRQLEEAITQVRQWVNHVPEAQVAPFAFLAMPSTTPSEQLLCASHWANQQFGHYQSSFQHPQRSKPLPTKIKVGYLSSDFRLHPLAFLITEVLQQHQREHVEVFAYSAGDDDQSAQRQALVAAVDTFVDIRKLSDTQAAALIHDDGIDILVDLTGYTKNSRTGVVALKPAPISINWLGYPGSMGTLHQQSLFDYMIVDHVVAHDVSMLSEKCLFLPCYQPNNTQREQGDAKDKTSHGLPEDAFVFCCFNQSFKITQTVFSAWMHILKQVPNSVLWLLACNEWAIRHLYQYAAQEGIAKERIIFAERVPIETHLARHQHADLFLDTLPYNAHTTASDALWCGLPVLTCIGDTFASRVSASLLTRLGLPNLITTSMTDYIQEAIHLAKSPQALSTIKHTIQLNHSQLFNSQSFTLALETTYREIFNQFHDA